MPHSRLPTWASAEKCTEEYSYVAVVGCVRFLMRRVFLSNQSRIYICLRVVGDPLREPLGGLCLWLRGNCTRSAV